METAFRSPERARKLNVALSWMLATVAVWILVAGWFRVVRHSTDDSLVKKVATTIAIGVVGGVVGYLAWAFVAQFFNPAS